MNKLFGSKTRTSLITKLMMEPDRVFHLRELSRETGIPYGMVHREIKNLTNLNIITREKKGNLTLIKANRSLPIYNDLRNIIIKTTGFHYFINNRIQGEIEYLLIFGSIAKHTDDMMSDIDLMLIGEVNELELVESVSQIEKEIRREVNYIHWTTDDFQKKIKEKSHILKDIADNPLIMLEGDEDEFRRVIRGQDHSENYA